MDFDEQQLKTFQHYLSNAKKVLCIVGAGMSASSGIPTYQWQRGLWRGYTSLDVATPEAFQNDPGLVWLFYSSRRLQALRARPNRGHFALAELCRRFPSGIAGKADNKTDSVRQAPQLSPKNVLVVSQNVDGLHQRASHPENSLVELHGNVFGLRCTQFFCNYSSRNNRDRYLTSALRAHTPVDVPRKKRLRKSSEDEESVKGGKKRLLEENRFQTGNVDPGAQSDSTDSTEYPSLPTLGAADLPICPACHQGILRPAVVWFGESLPLTQMDEVDRFFNVGGPVDLVLVIGSSGKVWPAMGYVERAKKTGSKVAIFNTLIDDLDEVRKAKDIWGFQGDAAKILPKALKPLIGEHYLPRDWRKR
ncbi:LADA_0A06084g1_1 [Lachancea dasiensis]|uniref:LADA_0A06084g1_1 n=1 Tax=Lachancea dasiensis TaxID=1072105 RepID=A0A1G4IPC1_9SACH|nr:LADA_0A06084g1_1 [Lachancea dasiensis]